MAGMWRKIGGVFLEFEDDGTTKTGKQRKTAPPEAPSPGALADDAEALLAQLDARKPARPRRARTSAPAPAPPPKPPAKKVDPLQLTPEAIYAAANISDNPNSADRILKMIAGLAAFPPAQQRAMIQALDAADPSWSEPEVLQDARGRQAALRAHLRAIEAEKTSRASTIQAQIKDVEASGRKNLTEIDKQIVELQKLREQQVASTAAQIEKLQAAAAELDQGSEAARHSLTDEINRLSGLMTFFTGGGAAQ